MRILMTGATGLIGREVGKVLVDRGDTLVCLVRDVAAARRRLPFPAECHPWDHRREVPAEALAGVEAVVHLAGEPVADGRWTPARKALIRDSRVLGTRRLVQAAIEHGARLRVFVHGSATGFYGDRGDATLDAHSARGSGFLADVVAAWEAELQPLARERPAVRVPVVRTGIVLARQGGALAQMLPLFRAGAAGRLGDGRQWMSWIHLDDVVRLFVHALDSAASGVLEGVAPHPATNAQFTTAFARALGVIENLPVPAAAIRALWGNRAQVVLGSTRVQPRATLASGFRFDHETVEHALDDLLSPLRGGVFLRVWEQWLPRPATQIWPFFCDANHLEEITPPLLHFEVLGMSTPTIGAGTRIDYRLRINGVPVRWQTLIDAWDPPRRFSDTQVQGPYSLWHHTHEFVALGAGTLMRDTVRYRLPAGWLGLVAAGWKVALDVESIFDYRARRIDERFGTR
ncbi:MAG: TIGR01777 family protein [Rubrivivax sp.]|nr:TIGR01777 family protein [Rubrivivax sp.]